MVVNLLYSFYTCFEFLVLFIFMSMDLRIIVVLRSLVDYPNSIIGIGEDLFITLFSDLESFSISDSNLRSIREWSHSFIIVRDLKLRVNH